MPLCTSLVIPQYLAALINDDIWIVDCDAVVEDYLSGVGFPAARRVARTWEIDVCGHGNQGENITAALFGKV